MQSQNINDDTLHNREEANNMIILYSLTTMAKNLKIMIETIQVVEWMKQFKVHLGGKKLKRTLDIRG